MTSELRQRVVELLEHGLSRSGIARELEIDPGTVTRYATEMGIPPAVRRSTKHDWAAIREYYEAGHSRRECMERFGFSEGAWSRAAARGDVVPRPRPTQRRIGETRAKVAGLHTRGMPLADIARELNVSKPTVSYHLRKLGVPKDERFSRRYDWKAIQRAHDEGLSVRECVKRFGFSQCSWSAAVKRGDLRPREWRIPIEELLVSGRKTQRGHLKLRLFAAGLKENRCERCGINEWMGEPLNMALHHINGDGRDNRLENLQMLCGNCHSQTPNWGGRNGHRRRQVAKPADGRAQNGAEAPRSKAAAPSGMNGADASEPDAA
jgi:DNA-binding NarL/FixJ family response regulator